MPLINFLQQREPSETHKFFSSFFSVLSSKNLLTSEQSYIILKSITKLPIDLAPMYYPTLLTIIWENPEAEAILGRDFDIKASTISTIIRCRCLNFMTLSSQMLKEYEKSALAKKNQLLHLLEI